VRDGGRQRIAQQPIVRHKSPIDHRRGFRYAVRRDVISMLGVMYDSSGEKGSHGGITAVQQSCQSPGKQPTVSLDCAAALPYAILMSEYRFKCVTQGSFLIKPTTILFHVRKNEPVSAEFFTLDVMIKRDYRLTRF